MLDEKARQHDVGHRWQDVGRQDYMTQDDMRRTDGQMSNFRPTKVSHRDGDGSIATRNAATQRWPCCCNAARNDGAIVAQQWWS